MILKPTGTFVLAITRAMQVQNTSNIYLLCQTSGGAVNIILPRISSLAGVPNSTWGFKIFVTDSDNNAAVNNITITPNPADKINGSAAPIVLNTNGVTGHIQISAFKTWEFSIGNAGGGSGIPYGNDTGLPNAYQVAIPNATLTAGYTFEMRVKAGNDNTGASTLRVTPLNALPLPLLDSDLNPLAPAMMEGDSIYLFCYNPTVSIPTPNGCYQLLGLAKPSPAPAPTWELDGNSNGAEKYIGTNDAFDFPIFSNGVEVGRFVAGTYFVFTYTPIAGAFANGDTIINGLGATGSIVTILSPTSALVNVTAGTFAPTNTLTSGIKSATLNSLTLSSNDGLILINQKTRDNGSNAGGQMSALRANRAQWRFNQYGANNAGGGITTFKSRALVVGAPLSSADAVLVGDIIQGFTAIAITNNGLIPLAYTQRLVVVSNTNGNVACDWEISLAPTRGTTNSIRKAFAISADGIPRLREATAPQEATYPSVAGLAVLDGTGTAVVSNLNVSASSRFNLTIQDGGAVPTGGIYISSRINGTSFTIKSMTGDAGVQVYWQMFEPQPVV